MRVRATSECKKRLAPQYFNYNNDSCTAQLCIEMVVRGRFCSNIDAAFIVTINSIITDNRMIKLLIGFILENFFLFLVTVIIINRTSYHSILSRMALSRR